MIKTYTIGEETWVDVDQGSPEEIAELMASHDLHPLVAKELSLATPKPRLEAADTYIYCILHFPVKKHTHTGEAKSQEIDFVVGQNKLITARYDTIDALHKFAKELEVSEVLKNDNGKYLIFPRLLHALYASLLEEMEYVEDMTEKITSNVFKGREKEMVLSISEMTQTLLDFKKVVETHEDILLDLRKAGEKVFGEDFAAEVDTVIEKFKKVTTIINTNLATLGELRQTNNSLLTAKQNETIKKLTIIGAILFILSILITLYH